MGLKPKTSRTAGASGTPKRTPAGRGAAAKRTPAGGRRAAGRAPARKAARVPARKAAATSRKATPGNTVDAYVAGLPDWQVEAATRLRQVIERHAPEAGESIKWGQPVYEVNGPFCYFRSSAEHLTFGFWRGAQLDDPEGLLEGDGERMKHVKIHSIEDVSEAILGGFIREAVALNERLGNPTLRVAEAEDEDEDEDEDDEDEGEGEGEGVADDGELAAASDDGDEDDDDDSDDDSGDDDRSDERMIAADNHDREEIDLDRDGEVHIEAHEADEPGVSHEQEPPSSAPSPLSTPHAPAAAPVTASVPPPPPMPAWRGGVDQVEQSAVEQPGDDGDDDGWNERSY